MHPFRTSGAGRTSLRPSGGHAAGRGQSALQPTFSPDHEEVIFTWVKRVPGSGNETTVPGTLSLDNGQVTAFGHASGPTHVRLRAARSPL